MDSAFKNFFQKRADFPRFKKKYASHQSYQCPQHVKVDFEKGEIHLPKIKSVKVKFHRFFEGKIKTCTITKTATEKYFVSILVELPHKAPPPLETTTEKVVGIDLGIKHLLVTSRGEQLPNHKSLFRQLNKLKTVQRRLSKKKKNSLNRVKARKCLAKLHEKTSNQRLDSIHQATAKLVYKSNDTGFAVEDLNVKGMMANHNLARSIGDCGWRTFLNFLQYKCTWRGKQLIQIDRWEPSSKICSCCGHVKQSLKLSERTYHCEYCGKTRDRDINAAINIKRFGLKKLGLDEPEDKPVDHALTGVIEDNLVIHGKKQEAPTRIALAI